jgi:gas vesicle protein
MTFRFLFGFLIGVILGASIALALAPQPGAETRHQLMDKVKERARRGDGDE